MANTEPSTPEHPQPNTTSGNRSFTAPLPPAFTGNAAGSPTASELASAQGVETLFVHPRCTIVKFTTPGASSGTSGSGKRGLKWTSPTERTVAAGSLEVYRVPGTVSFLRSGDLLHAIMARSQCWCVDGVSKFALRVFPDTYYRIELPGETDEDLLAVGDFKSVLSKLMHYERTACPFARNTTDEEDLPELEDSRNKTFSKSDKAKQWKMDRSASWKEDSGVPFVALRPTGRLSSTGNLIPAQTNTGDRGAAVGRAASLGQSSQRSPNPDLQPMRTNAEPSKESQAQNADPTLLSQPSDSTLAKTTMRHDQSQDLSAPSSDQSLQNASDDDAESTIIWSQDVSAEQDASLSEQEVVFAEPEESLLEQDSALAKRAPSPEYDLLPDENHTLLTTHDPSLAEHDAPLAKQDASSAPPILLSEQIPAIEQTSAEYDEEISEGKALVADKDQAPVAYNTSGVEEHTESSVDAQDQEQEREQGREQEQDQEQSLIQFQSLQQIPTDMPPSPPDSSAGVSLPDDGVHEQQSSSLKTHLPSPDLASLQNLTVASDDPTILDQHTTDYLPDDRFASETLESTPSPEPLTRVTIKSSPETGQDDPFAAIQARILARRSIGGTTTFYPSVSRENTSCSTTSVSSSISSRSRIRPIGNQRNFTSALVQKACAVFLGPPAYLVAIMLRIAARISNGKLAPAMNLEGHSVQRDDVPGSFHVRRGSHTSSEEDDFGVSFHSPVRKAAAKELRERKTRDNWHVD